MLGKFPPEIAVTLARLAEQEEHPEVRSQLAASAKRLPPQDAIPIIRGLLNHPEDIDDLDNPLLIWWALEAHAESDRKAVLSLLEDPAIWQNVLVQKVLLPRLMQRYIMANNDTNKQAVAQLLAMVPSAELAKPLLDGLQEGLRGQDVNSLPDDVLEALQPYQRMFGAAPLALALRQGKPEAVEEVVAVVADHNASLPERLTYMRILGEVDQPATIPVLLDVAQREQSSGAVKQAALLALQRYDNPEIGQQLLQAYPDKLRADSDVRLAALQLFASRPTWTQQLLAAIEQTKQISREDVPLPLVDQFKQLNDSGITATVDQLWPEAQLTTSAEKSQQIEQVVNVLKTHTGDLAAGKSIYQSRCGSCHRLFEEGGDIGPDLTGYDRRDVHELLLNIVDPNASIREGYVNYQIETNDDRTLVGTILMQDGNTVTLKPFGAEAITLSKGQIAGMQAQPTSLMPERLLDKLTEQQLSDLFAYIMQEQ